MIIENLATNPSFETASGVVTVRTNLCRNPVLGAAVTDWSVVSWGGGAGSEGRVLLGSLWRYQATFTTSPTAAGFAITNSASGNNVVIPGLTYSAFIYGQVSWAGAQMAARIFWYTSAGAYLSNGPVGAVATPTAGLGRSYTTGGGVAPADAAYARLDFYQAGGTLPPVNGTANATQGFVENAAVFGGFFYGANAAAGDFTYAWSGTTDASTSLQQAPGVAGGTSAQTIAIQSSEWAVSGNKSVRLIASSTTTSNTYYAPQGDGGAFRGGMVAGETYTAKSVIRIDEPQANALSDGARKIRFFYRDAAGSYQFLDSEQAPNVAGEYPLSVTVAIPVDATEAFIRLYNGASAGNGDVWWDDLLVVKGAYTGDYFDGDLPATDTITYVWTGVAHASTSRQVTYLDGANLTIGRFGTDIKVDSVSQWDDRGDRVTVSGQTPYGSVPDALTLRQQLMGYVDSPDETFVPVTWADQPSVNGFYRVLSARVDPHPLGAWAGVLIFSVELERVQGFASPLIECVALGKLRTSGMALTPRRTQAIPAGARSYAEYSPASRRLFPNSVDTTRAGATSVAHVYETTEDSTVGQFYVPPVKFYEAATTLTVGGRTVVGRQIENLPVSWYLSNDILEVRPVVADSLQLEFRLWVGTGWSGWRLIRFDHNNVGPSATNVPLRAPHTVTVLANSPEAVTIRLLTVSSNGYRAPMTIDLTLRRGSRHVAVEINSTFGTFLYVYVSSFAAPVARTGGWSNTGTEAYTVLGSPKSTDAFQNVFDFNQVTDDFRNAFPFCFGLTLNSEGVTGAQNMLNEYFWAASEKQTVAAR